MKVLQLCHKPPYPAVDGGCMAMNNVTDALIKQGHEVKVLTVATDKHPFEQKNYSKDYIKNTLIEACYINTKVNIIDAYSALVTADNYNVSRFFSPDFDQLLIETLTHNNYDIVHIESLFMTPYLDSIRKYFTGKVILRSHNLEHIIWERLASATQNKAKRIYIKYLARQLKKYEKQLIPQLDGIVAISEEDYKRYRNLGCSKKRLMTLPFGIDLDKYDFLPYNGNGNSFFHLGSMNWHPNQEAVDWLLKMVWPQVIADYQDLELHLAGNSMNIKDFEGIRKVVAHGEIEAAKQFIQQFGIMLTPLLSGGGMRIKIIEGMALGAPIISTKIGIEGIKAEHRKHAIISRDAGGFQKSIAYLKKNPNFAHDMSIQARKLVEEEYDNNKVIKDLIAFYNN